MGKFFGVVACVVTTAALIGCSKSSSGNKFPSLNGQADQKAKQTASRADVKESVKTQLCNKKETAQKISDAATANNVDVVLAPTSQQTVFVMCDGKENDGGVIINAADTIVAIPGATASEPVTIAEIESSRTCAKMKITSATVLDQNAPSTVQANGDLSLKVSTNVQDASGLNVAAGKNLLKIKYSKCTETSQITAADGTTSSVCTKSEVLAEKEVVLTVAINTQLRDGVNKVDKCEKTQQ